MNRPFDRRGFWIAAPTGYFAAWAGFVALVWVLSFAFRLAGGARVASTVGELADSEVPQASSVDGRQRLPRVLESVDYARGAAAPWWPKREAPSLRAAVEAGRLPPLAERVGPEPLVLDGGSIGKYGGTWRRWLSREEDAVHLEPRLGAAGLLRWSPLGSPVVPHLATRVRASADRRSFTIHLRPGVRWSDGTEFGSDDILFWWRYDATHPRLGSGQPPAWLVSGAGQTRLDAPDARTVRVRFDEPHADFVRALAEHGHAMTSRPRRCLQRFHPDLGDPDFLEQQLRVRGESSVVGLWRTLTRDDNPECPRLWPWVPRAGAHGAPRVYVRNPYFFAVDPAGNQLPYIDELRFDVTREPMSRVLEAGGVAMQVLAPSAAEYAGLKRGRTRGGYVMKRWRPMTQRWVLEANGEPPTAEERPEVAGRRRLVAEVRFREALSRSLDRHGFRRARGLLEASDASGAPPMDRARARRLLDELGLAGRDVDGMRRLPDGEPLALALLTEASAEPGAIRWAISDFREVGLRVVEHRRASRLFRDERSLRNFDLLWRLGEVNDLVRRPPDSERLNAVAGYGVGLPPMRSPLPAARRAAAPGLGVENVGTLVASQPAPLAVVVDAQARNVPASAVHGVATVSPSNAGMETYYFEQRARPSEAAPGWVRDVTSRATGGSGGLRWWPLSLLLGLFAVVAWRQPRARYTALEVGAGLLVLSVAAFLLSEWQQADAPTARVAALAGQVDAASAQQLEELRRSFHFDEPTWQRYLRWLGAYGLWNFNGDELGLLRGDLGTSLWLRRPVSEVIVRPLLCSTVLACGTLLVVVVVAVPWSLYAALRRSHFSDWALATLSLASRSAPPFLLALLLAGALGLVASPGEAGHGTSLAVDGRADLGQLGLAILALSASFAPAFVQRMHGHLVEELEKPYVTLARARGVPPLKLLLKYPMRLALSAFVQSSGRSFPQLVSAGAVVGIALGLPSLGPLQLRALQSGDSHLLAACLLSLGVLALLGRCISELVLLWLDPRTRSVESTG